MGNKDGVITSQSSCDHPILIFIFGDRGFFLYAHAKFSLSSHIPELSRINLKRGLDRTWRDSMKKEWLGLVVICIGIIILIPWSVMRWENEKQSTGNVSIRILRCCDDAQSYHCKIYLWTFDIPQWIYAGSLICRRLLIMTTFLSHLLLAGRCDFEVYLPFEYQ